MDGPEVPAPFKFVRPDCPPDAAESAATGKAQQASGNQSAVKQVNNTARSALEQVTQLQLFSSPGLVLLSSALLSLLSLIAGQLLHQQ